ncbi:MULTISPECIES: type IV conjugative transfer system protein TraL [Photobacterium]|uniref:Type IV conjugative transfer system protein TraL n=2 Tax=Photobacterium TaxID=657 RepID=A0A2T3M6A4_9GAMM
MENEQNFFKLPHYIDQGRIVMGMPLDVVLPAGIVFGLFAMAQYMMTGVALAALVFYALRTLKQSKGDNFIPLILYWYAPPTISRAIFYHTPPANQRYWLN